MAIEVDTIDLSLCSPDTGRYLTANIYYVDGVTDATGAPRALSIGQLVMALCLARASELEAGIVTLMNEMNDRTAKLEAMTKIEQVIVDWASRQTGRVGTYLDRNYTGSQASELNYSGSSSESFVRIFDTGPYAGVSYLTFLTDPAYGLELDLGGNQAVWVNVPPGDSTAIKFDDFVSVIESKMDEMNSFSQQKMIELQSQTAKRDQAYDMISNVLKSLNTVLVGNVNNM
ncbi:MAG: hypothetical protein J6U40_06995 [Kiritimatiellae bacterium]|nr:hypothetical protein [Kiritimatiellia bacterium]